MGETASEKSDGLVATPSGETAAGGTSGDTSSATTQTKRKRGRPRKSETAETLVPRLVAVEVPGAEKEEKSESKSKKSTSKKKSTKKPAQVDSTQIQMILLTISGIVASRPGMEVWNLTADEAKQIADPLANILQKSEAVANVTSEYADAIALVSACVMIFIPKYFVWKSMKPKKPQNGAKINYGNQSTSQPTNQTRTNTGSHQSTSKQSTDGKSNVSQNFNGQLHTIIAPVTGF